MSLKAKFVLLFYISGLIHHLYACYYSETQIDYLKNPKIYYLKKYEHRFFTSWNMLLQTIYLLMAFFFEIILLLKDNISLSTIGKVSKVRGFLFSSLVLPSAAIVSFCFWFLYTLNSEYVVPNGFFDIVPYWINHCIHTNIVILPIMELALQKLWIPSTKTALIYFSIYGRVYYFCYLYTYFESGCWLYPLYYIIDWPLRFFIAECMLAYGTFACFLGISFQKMRKNSDITKTTVKVVKTMKKIL